MFSRPMLFVSVLAAAIGLPLGAVLLLGQSPAGSGVLVTDLRCEYLSDPLGIDVQKPRLSWMLNAAAGIRGQRAYRVLVAGSPALLQKDQGDLWDTGRVDGSDSIHVVYAGKALSSGQRVYWKVFLIRKDDIMAFAAIPSTSIRLPPLPTPGAPFSLTIASNCAGCVFSPSNLTKHSTSTT
mgnify:CR=1 FL=1